MTLWTQLDYDGRFRFHAPGAHPATRRLVEHRRLMAAIHETAPTVDSEACLGQIDAQLAAFEQVESEEKMRAWERGRIEWLGKDDA